MNQRTAVVTGGCGGLGTAICKALVSAGRRVVSVDVMAGTPEADAWMLECRNDGFDFELVHADVADYDTVNTVSPGYLSTKMVMAVPEEVRNQIIAQIPVGRLGTAEDIADAVVFLARDETGFIKGANFSINGGQHMH